MMREYTLTKDLPMGCRLPTKLFRTLSVQNGRCSRCSSSSGKWLSQAVLQSHGVPHTTDRRRIAGSVLGHIKRSELCSHTCTCLPGCQEEH